MAAVKQFAGSAVDGATVGDVVVSTSAACNRLFADTLEGQSIRFAVGSAAIEAGSDPLLEAITTLAKSCPGEFSVEGHTDDTGNAPGNQRLSQLRAEAVVAALERRGLESSRMTALGFGSTRPKAPGFSDDARALNRRIEFRFSE